MLSKSEGRVGIGKARKSHTGSLDSLCFAKITLATAHKQHPIDLSIGNGSISLMAGLYLRGNGGRICFLAEAWKATTCETPTFFWRKGARGARVCRSRVERANEAIVSGEYDREEAETPFEYKRMKLETSGVRLGMSSFYGPSDWSMAVRPAEIGRYSGEKHLALRLSSCLQQVVYYMKFLITY